jgi:NADH-quinone oxidoreductase subunit E
MDISLQKVDEILLKYNFDSSSVIAMLQEIQNEAGYLPMYAMLHLAKRLGLSQARMQSLSTFYRSFSLVPTGRHKVAVCMGTACHIRGGKQLLEKLERDFEVPVGHTTPDRRYTLETVRCLGCCSLAPVVRVDGEVFGRLDQRKVDGVLKKYN